MKITVNISEDDYRTMVINNKAQAGSLKLLSATEGSFNAWKTNHSNGPALIKKLPHGRVTCNINGVRVTLFFKPQEETFSSNFGEVANEFYDAQGFTIKQIRTFA